VRGGNILSESFCLTLLMRAIITATATIIMIIIIIIIIVTVIVTITINNHDNGCENNRS